MHPVELTGRDFGSNILVNGAHLGGWHKIRESRKKELDWGVTQPKRIGRTREKTLKKIN